MIRLNANQLASLVSRVRFTPPQLARLFAEWNEDLHPRVPPGQGDPSGQLSGKGAMMVPDPNNEAPRARLRELKLPPAWKDVRISLHPNAKLQATGVDSKGRKPSDKAAIDTEGADFSQDYAKASEEPSVLEVLDTLEANAAELLVDAIRDSRDALKALVLRDFDGKSASWVGRLELKRWSAVQAAVGEMYRSAFQEGRGMAKRAIRKQYEDEGLAHEYARKRRKPVTRLPRASLDYFHERELFTSGAMKETLTKGAKNLLLQAMRNGEPIEETVVKLSTLFEGYTGSDDWSVADWDKLKPHKLATIVRTQTTDAYNHGILLEFRDPDVAAGIVALRYTAVLDDRTTDVCRHLSGWLFRVDDTRLDKVLPPNHFNCRSYIDPIINKRQAPKELFVTDEVIARAKELTPTDFGGSK